MVFSFVYGSSLKDMQELSEKGQKNLRKLSGTFPFIFRGEWTLNLPISPP